MPVSVRGRAPDDHLSTPVPSAVVAVPTTAGPPVAAGTGLSPGLWRRQYGYRIEPELTALKATALLLAEHIDRITDDLAFATHLIAAAPSTTEGERG
ncbi:hypothetical protein [Streptomyces mexicanus]|uniref:hypothetical protein n=1 Tax=Streptomyces mexicanus TaxID=178566 RepID=UPI0031F12E88